MIRIGLTGGIGSGKTTVANKFAELGVPVIDTDVIARELVDHNSEIQHAIADTFGDRVILPDGSLDRARLADIVFSDDHSMKRLEAILHPEIRRISMQRAADLENSNTPYVIFVVPLLFETDFHQLVDRKLVVTADKQLRCRRVSERDGRPTQEIEAIMSRQLDDTSRLQKADDIIENSDDIERLDEQVQALHRYYLSLPQTAVD